MVLAQGLWAWFTGSDVRAGPALRSFNGLTFFGRHLGSLHNSEQGALHFPFALGTPNDVPGPVWPLT